jgi:preprotein translocase subunit SecG
MSDLFGGGMSTTMGGTSVAERRLDRLTIMLGLSGWLTIVRAADAVPLVRPTRIT